MLTVPQPPAPLSPGEEVPSSILTGDPGIGTGPQGPKKHMCFPGAGQQGVHMAKIGVTGLPTLPGSTVSPGQ